MPRECACEVCAALAGLPPDTTVPQARALAEQLPRAVVDVLAAQARVRDDDARPGDLELVQAAAAACRAGRFARRGATQ